MVRRAVLICSLAFLAGVAIANPRPPTILTPVEEPDAVLNGSRTGKKIALTFDACSIRHPKLDQRIVQVLLETHTPATIFLGGKWMEEQPEQTKFLASIPQFELANHGYMHAHMTRLAPLKMEAEIEKTQQIMHRLTGHEAVFFRPPFGEYDNRVVHIAGKLGLETIEYDLASGDPDKHATKEKLIEYVTWKAKSGSIIVMHINGKGWHTAEALPTIISKLRKEGYTLTTLSDMLSIEPAQAPVAAGAILGRK